MLLLPSCSILERDAVPDVDVSPTAVRGILSTTAPKVSTPLPVMVTVTQNVVVPTAVLTITEPPPTAIPTKAAARVPSSGFSRLRFALTADGPTQSDFPAGTEEIYALWDYAGMSPSDTVRRIWFRDDQIWLTREEGWDWGEYGSEGTMRDISVYDNEGSGLPPATYRLQLYVNNELHAEGMFVVLGS